MLNVLSVIALCLPLTSALAAVAPSNSRVCIVREAQNGSLNISPTILSIRSQQTGKVLAHKRLDDGGSFCAELPRGQYVLSVRFAEPWTRSLPLHWWTRTFALDLRRRNARFLMTNPRHNDHFQAMVAGPDGWHRLWRVQRVR